MPEPANTEFVAGLRALADWYEAHPEAELSSSDLYVFPDNTEDQVRLYGRWLGTFDKSADDNFFTLVKHFGPIELRVCFARTLVCQKRIVGTKKIKETVPDPAAPKITAEIPDPDAPLVEIEREEEIVEWDCPPLLAPEKEQAA